MRDCHERWHLFAFSVHKLGVERKDISGRVTDTAARYGYAK